MRPIGNTGLAIAAALLLTGGCAAIEEHPERVAAPVAGGAVGLAAGDAIGTTAARAGLGAVGVIAGVVAAPYLEKRDTVYFDRAIDVAAEAKPGEPIQWVNPNTGTTGTMVREGDVDIDVDLTCRRLRSEEKTQTEIKVETMVVCKPDMGTWYIKSSWLVEKKPIDTPPKALLTPQPDTARATKQDR